MSVAGVILAAGESTRMGQDKALLPWPPLTQPSTIGTSGVQQTGTLLSAAIRSLSDVCEIVIVVAGKNEPTLRQQVYACGAFLVRNPAPERGQFSTLQVGLREVLNHGRDAAVINLVDRPPALTATLAKLIGAFERRARDAWAIVPDFEGKHGHPTIVGREMIEAFLRAPAGANAREIEHANQSRITYVPVDDLRVTMNINTPEDYIALGRIADVIHP